MDKTVSLDSELFADRYKLGHKLGDGGMGTVFAATDTVLEGEQLAVKILHADFCTEEHHVKRFLREIQLTRKVTHANVVRTFDAGVSEGRLFFTMELIEGETLKEIIKRGPMDPLEVARILVQVTEALAAIHSLEIVHRDMKPSNIMVSKDGEVKITDFGVAKPGMSDLTGHNEIVGSAPFMAPEVWAGRDVTVAADIYSLGICAYEMLTGELPFQAEAPAELMWKHLEVPPTPPSQLVEGLPSWIEKLVLVMLEKDGEKRPYAAVEITDYLLDCMNGQIPGEVTGSGNRERDLTSVASQTMNDPFVESVPLTPTGDDSGYFGSSSPYDEDVPESGIGAKLPEHACLSPDSELVEEVSPGYWRRTAAEAPPWWKGLTLFGFIASARRACMSAALSVLIAALLFGPLSDFVSGWWNSPLVRGSLEYYVAAAVLMSVLYGLIAGFPILPILLLNHSWRAASRVWLRMSAACVILFGAVAAYNTALLVYECHKRGLDMKRIDYHTSVEPAAAYLASSVLLSPIPPAYTTTMKNGKIVRKKLLGNSSGSPLDYLPAIFLYLIVAVSFFRMVLGRGLGKSGRRVSAVAFTAMAVIFVAEMALIPLLGIGQSVQGIAEPIVPRIGVYYMSFPHWSLYLFVANWCLLYLTLSVLCPLLDRRNMKPGGRDGRPDSLNQLIEK